MYNKSLSLGEINDLSKFLGADLDEREMQYGDDYILLVAVTLLEEYSKNNGNIQCS